MNAGIIFEDEDVPMTQEESEEVKKTREQLDSVKLLLTEKITSDLKDQYRILRENLSTLTGSVAW